MGTCTLYLFNLLIFVFIWIKLLITNHWTTGKKLLVGLIGSIIWYQGTVAYLIIVNGLLLSAKTVSLYLLPLTVVGLLIVYAVYKTKLE